MDKNIVERISPFSNGIQYMAWDEANCCRCKKYYDENKREFLCDIQQALSIGAISDGMVSAKIAQRMGYDPQRYNWPCGEVEWTDEWKAEYAKRHPLPQEGGGE